MLTSSSTTSARGLSSLSPIAVSLTPLRAAIVKRLQKAGPRRFTERLHVPAALSAISPEDTERRLSMERHKAKRSSLAILAGFCLGTISAYGIYHDAVVRIGPTRAHAEGLQPSAATPAAAVAKPAPVQAWDPLAADPKLSQPPAANATPGEVRLSARLDRKAVLVGSDGRVQVQLTLSAPDAVSGELPRQPSDVLVVLDISGSMEGQKLAYAKRALHQLIGRIGPSDRFGLITYESSASLVVPMQAPGDGSLARWHRAVDALEASGGTNMSAGLDLASAQLGHSARNAHSARVLLLSDGHANEGDSSPRGLQARARRIVRTEDVLTTMGIGDDFNEDLMTSLAEVGTGNFYYLSRVETIGRFFDAELRASTQTVARALTLQFDAAPGSVVLDVSGYPMEQHGTRVSVRPGNLYAGQKRTLWVTLQVPTERRGEQAIGRFSLAYKRAEKAFAVTADALPTIRCVDDQASFERGIDREVWEQAVTTQQYQRTQLALGKAIGEGDAADVDREVKNYGENRRLAEKLGSTKVLRSMDALDGAAVRAKAAQAAPSSKRQFEAKQHKARAVFELRSDAYNDDPLEGL
jgi:Ca-activated chloride channel family protein